MYVYIAFSFLLSFPLIPSFHVCVTLPHVYNLFSPSQIPHKVLTTVIQNQLIDQVTHADLMSHIDQSDHNDHKDRGVVVNKKLPSLLMVTVLHRMLSHCCHCGQICNVCPRLWLYAGIEHGSYTTQKLNRCKQLFLSIS